MTDHRPPTPGIDPTDPFERELRALLRDRAAGPMPESLRDAAAAAVRTPAGPAGIAAWRRPMAGLVAAGIAIILMAGAFNPIASLMQAVAVPTASATPRTVDTPDKQAILSASPLDGPVLTPGPSGSPNPVAPGFDWGDDQTTFTADSLVLTVGGGGEHRWVGKVPSRLAPTRRHLAAGVEELRWDWVGEDRTRLTMRVESDGSRWSVTEVTYHDSTISDDPSTWSATPIAAGLGEPWTGDLVLAASAATGYPGSVRITGLTLDPGLTAEVMSAPPAVTPAPPAPFAIDNGSVRLTADSLDIQVLGDTLHGPVGVGGADPASHTLQSDQLHATWFDDGKLVQLTLDFRSDGERWRATSGELSAWFYGYALLDAKDLAAITAALGSPFTGDLTLTLPQWSPGPPDHHVTGRDMVVTIRNLSIEPFRAVMARTMIDCRPVVSLGKAGDGTDPAAKGQPLAGTGLVGMDAAAAAAVVQDLGYCYLFDRRLSVDPSLGISGINETWCDAPPGTVTGLRYGKGGELHLIVVTQVPRGTPKRPQPIVGFGCKVGVPLPSDPPLVTPAPAATPLVVAPMSDKPVTWDTGDVRLAADAVVLRVGAKTYSVEPGLHGGAPDMNGDLQVLNLAMAGDDGTAQVRLSFASDGTTWTLHHFEVYGAGLTQELPSSVAGVGAPLSEQVRGDLVLPADGITIDGSVDVSLELRGAELQAFRGVTARTLRDCQSPGDLRSGASDRPMAAGQPLDGLGLDGAPARKAAAAMERLGYCYVFSLQGSTADGRSGWGEQWCDAPPGKVDRAVYGDQGEVMFVVASDQIRAAREQPPVGWGCLTDVPGYATPSTSPSPAP